jgi:hypothetical protein
MENTIEKETTKKEWAKPTVTQIDVKDTETGSFRYEIEDPYNHFYGPHS